MYSSFNVCHECADQRLGIMQTVAPAMYVFGARKAGSSSDGYEKPDVLRSFPDRLSAGRGVDSCCAIGRDTLKQVPNSLSKPYTIHRKDFLGEPLVDDEIVNKPHPHLDEPGNSTKRFIGINLV